MRSIRSVNALEIYFKNGLSKKKLFKYKNYALQYFLPDIIKLMLNLKNSHPYMKEIFFFFIKNCYYTNIYLSIFYQIRRSINKLLKNEKNL